MPGRCAWRGPWPVRGRMHRVEGAGVEWANTRSDPRRPLLIGASSLCLVHHHRGLMSACGAADRGQPGQEGGAERFPSGAARHVAFPRGGRTGTSPRPSRSQMQYGFRTFVCACNTCLADRRSPRKKSKTWGRNDSGRRQIVSGDGKVKGGCPGSGNSSVDCSDGFALPSSLLALSDGSPSSEPGVGPGSQGFCKNAKPKKE